MNIANKIFELRTRKNLSQGDLAEKIGVSRQSISKWETGGSVPDLDKILLLSKIFDVSVDFLVKDEIDFQDDNIENNNENAFNSNFTTFNNANNTANFVPQKQNKFTISTILGLIFIGIGVMGMLLSLILSAKIILVAIIILVLGILLVAIKKHVVLTISWILFILIQLFGNLFTGLSLMIIFNFNNMYSRVIMGMLLVFLILSVATVFQFKTKITRLLAGACCFSYLLLNGVISDIRMYFAIANNGLGKEKALELLLRPETFTLDILSVLFIGASIFFSIRYYINWKKK